MPPKKTKSSLLERNPLFRNFLCATTVSLMGTNVFDIAMPLYVLEKTHSALAVSMVAFCLHLPHFLMAPLTGFIADHFNKRRIMLYTDIGQVVCLSFLLIYELTSVSDSLWPIMLTVFIAKSLMNMFETVTTFQLIPAMVSNEDLSAANSWFLSAHRLIQVVGPLTGGMLLGILGVKTCILLNIISFGATLFFTLRLRDLEEFFAPAEASSGISLKNVYKDFRQSVTYVWGSPLFRPFIFLMFCWNFSSMLPNSPTFLYYYTEIWNYSALEYGMVASLLGILGVAGYLKASNFYKERDFYSTFVGSCLWQTALSTLALFFFGYPLLLTVIFGVSRMGSSMLTMGTFLLRQTRIPPKKSGGVNACIRMFFMSSAPLSALLQAFVIQRYGVRASLVLGAVFLWATLWYAKEVALAIHREDELPKRKRAA